MKIFMIPESIGKIERIMSLVLMIIAWLFLAGSLIFYVRASLVEDHHLKLGIISWIFFCVNFLLLLLIPFQLVRYLLKRNGNPRN